MLLAGMHSVSVLQLLCRYLSSPSVAVTEYTFASVHFHGLLSFLEPFAPIDKEDGYAIKSSVCAVVPNGTATGLDIGLSNFSLSLITLSFYTMCKSTTPVFLLFFCFAWGLERYAAHAPSYLHVYF